MGSFSLFRLGQFQWSFNDVITTVNIYQRSYNNHHIHQLNRCAVFEEPVRSAKEAGHLYIDILILYLYIWYSMCIYIYTCIYYTCVSYDILYNIHMYIIHQSLSHTELSTKGPYPQHPRTNTLQKHFLRAHRWSSSLFSLCCKRVVLGNVVIWFIGWLVCTSNGYSE